MLMRSRSSSPWLTDRQRLMTDLVTGNRLLLDPALQFLILNQLSWALDSEVNWQNHLIYSSIVREKDMREVHDLAAGMKEMIAGVKRAAAEAKNSLSAEINRAHVNADKVKSMTDDLKSANLEVEDFLGESGSNFPPSGNSDTPHAHADSNGVTLNPGARK
jgi:hypothetical protein